MEMMAEVKRPCEIIEIELFSGPHESESLLFLSLFLELEARDFSPVLGSKEEMMA